MNVNEIFLSIQAESLNLSNDPQRRFGVGVPTIFVRFNACNIQCDYCDTAYTWGKGIEKGDKMTPTQIVTEVQKVGGIYKTVCITGGAPELQDQGEMHQLIRGLKDLGYVISIEASGTAGRDFFHGADSIVMDIKGPSAGTKAMACTECNMDFARRLTPYDQLKFLVKDRKDFDWMLDWLKRSDLLNFAAELRPLILVSPAFDDKGGHNAADVVEWMLAEQLDAVLNFQIHKVIWPVEERGV